MLKRSIWVAIFLSLVGVSTAVVLKNREKSCHHQGAGWGSLKKAEELKAVLHGFGIRSMIDMDCEEVVDLGLERYIGVDRRAEVISAIKNSIGSAERSYLVRDITKDQLPKADLILCWDKLFELSPSKLRSTIELFKKSGCKYLLVSHFPDLVKNHKTRRGLYQPINWTLEPYRFPEPMIQINEEVEGTHIKNLALWNINDLP